MTSEADLHVQVGTHWLLEGKVERSKDSGVGGGASIEVGGGSRYLLGSSDLTAALFKTLIMELGKFYFRYIKLIYIFVYFSILQSS